MPALLPLAIAETAKLIIDHLYDIIAAVAGFLLAVFVKDPIKEWWQGRGKLAKARKAMYQDLAEILTDMQFFCGGVNQAALDQNTSPGVWTLLVESFYQRIKSHNYDEDLKALRSSRTSVGAEVRGFEGVIGLIDNLPNSNAPILERAKAVIAFNGKLTEAIATEPFDMKRVSEALENVQREERSRHWELLAKAIADAAIVLKDSETVLKQSDEVIGEVERQLAKDKAEIEATEGLVSSGI